MNQNNNWQYVCNSVSFVRKNPKPSLTFEHSMGTRYEVFEACLPKLLMRQLEAAAAAMKTL